MLKEPVSGGAPAQQFPSREEAARPGGPQRALMLWRLAECERNYVRLVRLLRTKPQASGEPGFWEIACQLWDHWALLVTIREIELGRHTGTLWIEQRLVEIEGCQDRSVPEPPPEQFGPWLDLATLKVRLYHDCKSAEPLEITFHKSRSHCCPGRCAYSQHEPYPEKFQGTRFLAEILGFCLESGRLASERVLEASVPEE